jgi:hypothetical protein
VKREPLRIGAGGGPENRFHGRIDDVRIYKRALSPAEAGILADLTSVTAIAAMADDKRTTTQADKIRDYFIENALPASIAEARARLTDAQAKRDAFYQSLPTVMVMEEMPVPRETHLLIRGMYDKPGEVVTPMLPAVWMAGGGIKPGITIGETDDYGYNITQDPVHVHDLNATILRCLGIDHKRLTYKYQGRNFRLTDTAGRVVQKALTFDAGPG